MDVAAIMNPLSVLQKRRHASLGLAQRERVVRFLGAHGPFQCYGCVLLLFLDLEK